MIVLGAKTDYSFLRGYGTPQQWLARCKEVGVKTLGLADYCSCWGHAPFRDAFKDSGVKLMFGVQIPVVAWLSKDPRHSLVTLYARHDLSELYQSVSLAHQQTYYRPRLTWKQVKELKDCYVVVNNLLRNEKDIASTLDSSRCFVANDQMILGLKKVVDYSPRFPSPDDRVAFTIFQSISSGSRIGEIEFDATHMLRRNEVTPAMEAMACTADIPTTSLLAFDVGDKRARLWAMACDGAKRLGLLEVDYDQVPCGTEAWKEGYKARLVRELDVICEKKFEDYFFFVADICEWADQRMLLGPGRGSAGGSLLCYLLGITHVDPLRFGTMFDRFIDITRSDLPDIDIDFPDNRREEVFEYMKQKYGAERFARLGTLTELGGKSALNAVARAYDIPFDASREVGKFTEGAGQGAVVPFAKVFAEEAVKPILERHPSLLLAELIDGHVSHHGVHASGCVVTDRSVNNFGVVDREGVLSMDMRTAEKQGFVKIDALGLKTLSVIQECCDLIGMDPRDLRKLDFDDTTVFDAIFNKDHVTGIFQFEGNAVRSLMKGITVDKFDDLCALTSLARPGPLVGGAAAGWVKSRNGDAARDSIHPSLDSTYGTLAYQEQMMYVARDVALLSIPDVNGMRRAVAKKDPEKLRAYREKFIAGCQRNEIGDEGAVALTKIPHESEQGNDRASQDQKTPRKFCDGEDQHRVSGEAVSASGASGTGGISPGSQNEREGGSRTPHGLQHSPQQPSQSPGPIGQVSQAAASRDGEQPQSQPNKLADSQRTWRRVPLSADRAEELWEEINEFGSYSFNLAHAVAYAMLSFMTAWLKAKHPLEFAVAQLKYAADDDTAKHLLRELTEEGYKYIPFDVNKSLASWSISDGALLGGFDSIRGIGTKTAERYVAMRALSPDWLDDLTDAQRTKVTQAKTAWHDLSYFSDKFGGLYKSPGDFRSELTPKGIKPPVYRIRDIPEAKGEYAFIGRITSVKHVDANEPERIAKRDGKKFTKDTHFINLKIEDDTGELGATINRFKAANFLWLVEEDLSGRDFLFRGNVIEQGRKWLFIEKVIELK